MTAPFDIYHRIIEIPITPHLENTSNEAISDSWILSSSKWVAEANSNNSVLSGDLNIPMNGSAIIIFAHGSGSGRESKRNLKIANALNNAGLATLVVDLLTLKEMRIANETASLEFDTRLLANRLKSITKWVNTYPATKNFKVAYLGSSTGAAAALVAATEDDNVSAILCRGARIDLAITENVLENISIPILLVVGSKDYPIIEMNKEAYSRLKRSKEKELIIIPDASHLFEEPNKIEEVAIVATNWFERHLRCTQHAAPTVERSVPCHQHLRTMKGKMRITSRMISIFRGDVLFRIKFKDRKSAAEVVAAVVRNELKHELYMNKNDNYPITVVGIARGGAVIADRVAAKLSCNFDIIISRRLLAPYSVNAFGAIVNDGTPYVDEAVVNFLNIPETYLKNEKMQQLKEVNRMVRLYRPHGKEYAIRNRTVVLIDDGASTGASLIAAARMIRKEQPKLLMIAVPVSKPNIVEKLKREADIVQVILTPSTFAYVSQFYQNYDSIPDTEILEIMHRRGIWL